MRKPKSDSEMAGSVLRGLGHATLPEQGEPPAEGECLCPEDLAGWVEGRLRGRRRRDVERLLRTSPACRAQLAGFVESVRDTGYGRDLLRKPEARPGVQNLPVSLLAWLAETLRPHFAPGRLAFAAVAVIVMAGIGAGYLHMSSWPQRMMRDGLRLADSGDWGGARGKLALLAESTGPGGDLRSRATEQIDQLYVREGMELEKRGDYRGARTVLDEAVTRRPRNVMLLAQAGNARLKAARVEKGLPPDFGIVRPGRETNAMTKGPVLSGPAAAAGVPALPAEEVSVIAGLFDRALREDPDNLSALLGLAEVQLESGDIAGARKAVERARDRAAGDTQVMGLLGQLFAQEGKLSEAEKSFEEVLRLQPQNQAAHANLAVLYEVEGLDERSRKHLDQLDDRSVLEGLFREKK